MYIKWSVGYVVAEITKAKDDFFRPEGKPSRNWKYWHTIVDGRECDDCESMHGKMYAQTEDPPIEPLVHPNCRCEIRIMTAVQAGGGTKDGENGADWWIQRHGQLPEYYISELDIKALGWSPGKSPINFAAGKMMTKEVYDNSDKRLPDAPGRIWHEADLNYYAGKRNGHRLLWSNDGLLFTTYDHYHTFYEII